MEPKSNKKIVLEFYKNVVRERNIGLIDTYVSDNYVQHSPSLKSGKAGLLEAMEFLKKLPKPNEQKSPIIHAIEDDDYVMTHLDFELMGTRKNVIDLFRLENGKVIEHWDAVQDITEKLPAHIPSYNAEADSRDSDLTENNKSLIHQFFLGNRQQQKLLLSEEYIEHNSEVSKIAGRLDAYFDRSIRSDIKLHRILGENNLVLAQSEAIKSTRPFVFYDLFSVIDDKIAEHWCVEQEIPDVMRHDNGMI